jgi:integrase
MTRQRLTPDQVAALIRDSVGQKQVRHPDGNNFYLVTRNGRGFWVYQYWQDGIVRSKGLGPCPPVTPAQARKARDAFVVALRSGTAPMIARRPVSSPARAGGKTFGQTVLDYLAEKAPHWRGGTDGLEAKDYKVRLTGTPFAALPMASITTPDVRAALAKWAGKPSTWNKVQGRIERVLDWATATGLRSGENPARLVGLMEHFREPAKKVIHHPAMPGADVPLFMRELRDIGTHTARALQFTILAAARTSESIGAKWAEIEGDTWTIPASRMKEGVAHSVPLSAQVLALIGTRGAATDFIFPGRRGKPLHSHAMQELLRRERPGFTCHGFRSTFTDWAAENEYPAELREMALAHAVGDATERAYRRTNLVNRRREMMAAWAKYACQMQGSQ